MYSAAVAVAHVQRGGFDRRIVAKMKFLCWDVLQPNSTQYKVQRAVDVFQNWQPEQQKIPLLKPGIVFKDKDVPCVQTLEERWEDLGSLSLNFWLTNFVQEVAVK